VKRQSAPKGACQPRRQARHDEDTTRRTLYLGPEIGDDLPPAVKDLLATRRVAALNGRCPSCGTTGEVVPDALTGKVRPGTVTHILFVHDENCPAVQDDFDSGDAA
jgi:hypothetical protein